MSAVRYKGPPDTIRLGARLVKIGDTISAPDALVTQLLSHKGFEKIAETREPSLAKVSEKPAKKLKKKPSTEGEK